MDKQMLNRLKYLRQNQQYLSKREEIELENLEQQLSAEAVVKSKKKRIAQKQEKIDYERKIRQQEENARIEAAQARQAKQKVRKAGRRSYREQPLDAEIEKNVEPLVNPIKTLKHPEGIQKLKKEKKSFSVKNLFKRVAITVGILLAGIIILLVIVFNDATQTLKKTYVDIGNNAGIAPDRPLTLVFMGVDTGDITRGGKNSWNGNSDSQIVMTLNPKTNTTTMVSMERDTMTPILDNTGEVLFTQKMNAAYPLGYNAGGISFASQYAMMTIGAQAGITINNFVIINMDGLVSLVDNLGGIEVINDSGVTLSIANTEPEYTATVPYIEGNPPQHINGEQALVFSRDRDNLPNGDYGRAAHQREVLTAIFKKLLTINTALNYHKILEDISQDFKTNISADMRTLSTLIAYRNCFDKIVSIQYEGISATAADSSGTYASYQLMPEYVALAVQNLLRQSIGLPAQDNLGDNVITYESYFGSNPTESYFMPSASVTKKGEAPTVYGVDIDGSFVTIDSSNANMYVSTTGAPVKSQ